MNGLVLGQRVTCVGFQSVDDDLERAVGAGVETADNHLVGVVEISLEAQCGGLAFGLALGAVLAALSTCYQLAVAQHADLRTQRAANADLDDLASFSLHIKQAAAYAIAQVQKAFAGQFARDRLAQYQSLGSTDGAGGADRAACRYGYVFGVIDSATGADDDAQQGCK